MLGRALDSPGPGGGQGWRETQWETVLRLVANLITPGSLFRLSVRWSPSPHPSPAHPPTITTDCCSSSDGPFPNPRPPPPPPLSTPLLQQQSGTDVSRAGGAAVAAGQRPEQNWQPDEVLHCPAAAAPLLLPPNNRDGGYGDCKCSVMRPVH